MELITALMLIASFLGLATIISLLCKAIKIRQEIHKQDMIVLAAIIRLKQEEQERRLSDKLNNISSQVTAKKYK